MHHMSEQQTPIGKLAEGRPVLFIGLGFALIVLLMGSLVAFGLAKMSAMHDELEVILTQHNAKIELVQTMRHIVRERMIRMYQITIEEDPFKRDEINMTFNGLASQFINTRDKLQAIAQSVEEKRQFDRLRELVVRATPFHEKVVELLNRDEMLQARQLLNEKSIPAQLGVMGQTDRILEHYKQAAEVVEQNARAAFQKTAFAMITLGGLAAAISIITAVTVLRRVRHDRDALQRANDTLEAQVVERTRDLTQTAERLAEAQRIAHTGHFDWNLSDGVLYWSEEVYRIFGLTQEKGASREIFMGIVFPDDRQYVETMVNRALFEQSPYAIDHRIVLPNGAIRVVHQQGEVSYDSAGKPQRMLGTIQDVTERKETEAKLQLAANVFESASEGILITDADNNIVDVNGAFMLITGFKREEVLGQNPRMFKSGKHDPSFYREMWKSIQETDHWQGEIWGKRKFGAIYPKWQTINVIRDTNGRITHYIAVFRDISDAKKHEEQLWKLAHFDNLCGVANRSLMYANLRMTTAHARREKSQVALMLFDLDRFKQVNDTFGHDAGDQLLVHVAKKLMESVRECDTVARLGGDEFTVILGNIREKEDVVRVTQKMQRVLATPLKLKSGQELIIGASIGIALYPSDAPNIETLMKNADRAMYHAKELGRNNYQFFEEGMTKETQAGSPTT